MEPTRDSHFSSVADVTPLPQEQKTSKSKPGCLIPIVLATYTLFPKLFCFALISQNICQILIFLFVFRLLFLISSDYYFILALAG